MLLVFIAVSALVAGCLEELEDIDNVSADYSPTVALPIANSTFNFEDFLLEAEAESFIDIDSDGLISLVYRDSLSLSDDLLPAQLFSVFNQTFSQSINIPGAVLAALPGTGSQTFSVDLSFPFNVPAGQSIDSIFLNSGDLAIDLTASGFTRGDLAVTFHSLKDNNTAVVFNNPFETISVNRNLADHVVDLTASGGTNSFDLTVEFTLEWLPGDPNPPASSQLDFTIQLIGPRFRAIFGDIGTVPVVASPIDINIEFFNNVTEGNFFLADPQLNFTFTNTFGMPIAVDLSSLAAFSSTQGLLPLTGTIASSPVTINGPTLAQYEQAIVTDVSVDNTNSNVADFISLFPEEIQYQFLGLLNPGGTGGNYVLNDSDVKVNLDFELPLFGQASNFKLEKEFDGVDGPGIFSDLVEASIRIEAINGLPIGTDLQLDFLRSDMSLIDSLLMGDQRIVLPAPVDAQGEPTGVSEKVITVPLSDDLINRLVDTAIIRVRATTFTTNDGTVPVKFFIDDELTIKLGVITELDFSD